MSPIRRFDHVGITVRDLDTVTDFFVGLGFETEGRTFLEGEFLDTVIGIPDSRTEVVMLRPPRRRNRRWNCRASSAQTTEPGSPDPMPNELGLRNVTFEVDDLQALLDRLAADGYHLVGGVGRVRGQLAHGVRARTRGVHRERGPANRLIGGTAQSLSFLSLLPLPFPLPFPLPSPSPSPLARRPPPRREEPAGRRRARR